VKRWVSLGFVAWRLSLLATAACATNSSEPTAAGGEAIIGGIDATDARWNAIGCFNSQQRRGKPLGVCRTPFRPPSF